MTTAENKVEEAIKLIVRYGSSDESHHLRWLIDQITRTLAGDAYQYHKIVAEAKAGEEGPETYSWDEGIAP